MRISHLRLVLPLVVGEVGVAAVRLAVVPVPLLALLAQAEVTLLSVLFWRRLEGEVARVEMQTSIQVAPQEAPVAVEQGTSTQARRVAVVPTGVHHIRRMVRREEEGGMGAAANPEVKGVTPMTACPVAAGAVAHIGVGGLMVLMGVQEVLMEPHRLGVVLLEAAGAVLLRLMEETAPPAVPLSRT